MEHKANWFKIFLTRNVSNVSYHELEINKQTFYFYCKTTLYQCKREKQQILNMMNVSQNVLTSDLEKSRISPI